MKPILSVVLLLALGGCSSSNQTTTPSPTANAVPIRVLMLTATEAFRHDSIGTAHTVMSTLAASSGEFRATITEQLSAVNANGLAGYDVLLFALTSGELPFTIEQKTAVLNFVNGGGGFIGVHSAADTLYEWPEYERLIGAYFKEHPWTQRATVVVEDQTHPVVMGLGESFSIDEEFYTFRRNPRPTVQVLLRLDAASVGSTGDYPLAWVQSIGRGKAYYNALGHNSSTWNDARFQRQLLGAIRWVATH